MAIDAGDVRARFLRRYERLWHAEFDSNFRASSMIQRLMSHGGFVNLLVRRAARSQDAADMFAQIVGDLLPKRLFFSWGFVSQLLR
jgi:hypothetical protein